MLNALKVTGKFYGPTHYFTTVYSVSASPVSITSLHRSRNEDAKKVSPARNNTPSCSCTALSFRDSCYDTIIRQCFTADRRKHVKPNLHHPFAPWGAGHFNNSSRSLDYGLMASTAIAEILHSKKEPHARYADNLAADNHHG